MIASIEPLIIALSKRLKKRDWKVVTAESCTGGGLAYFLTHLPGSSAWYDRGFVTYSNAAKEESLGVPSTTLTEFGAVSAQTACAMANGALRHSEAQVSIAITGIAGPSGGTIEKPVGTVWFALAGIKFDTYAEVHYLQGNRAEIREKSIVIALENLLHKCD